MLKKEERKHIVKRICAILKHINTAKTTPYELRFSENSSFSWQERIVSKISTALVEIEVRKILASKEINTINNFVFENKYALLEQDIRLVYWDIHFDNVIVLNNKIAGIIDFERTELCSIDFVLDVVKRMVDFPKKYASAQSEKYVLGEDYEDLLEWYKEFYPELFHFEYLNIRLALYSVVHDLDTLLGWPDDEGLKKIILKTAISSYA